MWFKVSVNVRKGERYAAEICTDRRETSIFLLLHLPLIIGVESWCGRAVQTKFIMMKVCGGGMICARKLFPTYCCVSALLHHACVLILHQIHLTP